MIQIAGLVIRFCLALWVGGTLLVVLAAPVLFARISSRDVAGDVFGEILRRFEVVKQVLSLLLVLAVFFQLERTGGFAGQSISRWFFGLAWATSATRSGPSTRHHPTTRGANDSTCCTAARRAY